MKLEGFARAHVLWELGAAVGVDHVLTGEDVCSNLAIDQSWTAHMWRAKGQVFLPPDFVVRPSSTAEVSRVMGICHRYKVPVIPRGGGSGTAGGAVSLFGGVLLDLTRMDKIFSIDKSSLVLTAQSGINGRVLEDALNAEGLMLAHYPSSVDISSLGGYLAARGSGVMSTKYGKAEDMVLHLEVVLPDGRVVNTLPVPNHACGPGLLQLFVGAEGTLGVITKVSMRLDPLPETRLYRSFKFPGVGAGLAAGAEVMRQRLNPAVMRLYDPGSTAKSLKPTGMDVEGVVLVVVCDGFEEIAEGQMRRIADICRDKGAADLGEELGKHWWDTRYVAYKPPVHPAFPQMYGTPETVTDYANIEALYLAKKKVVEEKWGASYTAHFSHWYPWGTMIYDRFYVASPPENPQEMLRLHNDIWLDCVRVNLEHGGVLNEHHGIGMKLGPFMAEQYGEAFNLLQGIKNLLDPRGIMNPGKLGFELH